jgi:hypothetical protein
MGKKTPTPPAAPDPRAVAQAQTGSNIGTAIANTWMGNANEFSPYGNVVYSPTGYQTVTVDGKDYQVPQFERTMWLDPAEQQLLDQQRLLGYGMNNLAISQTGRLDDLLGSPITAGNSWPARMTNVPDAPSFNTAPKGPRMDGVELSLLGDGNDPRYKFGNAGDIQRSIGPTDYSEDRRRVEEALYSRLNPQLERDRASLETTLVNQGYTRGSEAFNTAMDEHTRQANDARMQTIMAGGQEQTRLADLALQSGMFTNAAQEQQYNQLLGRGQFYNQAQQQNFAQNAQTNALNNESIMGQAGFNNQAAQQQWQNAMGRNEYNNAMEQAMFGNQSQQVQMQNALREQALQEDLALRNQPINEITALMSGGQVTVPQFSQYQGGQVGQVPVGQYMYQSAAQDQQNWATQQQARSQMLGGLFNLGGMAAYGMMSDRRLKRGIERLGITANGLDLYSYRYVWDNDNVRHVGVMADEVKAKTPEAVVDRGGFDAVDYTLAMAA